MSDISFKYLWANAWNSLKKNKGVLLMLGLILIFIPALLNEFYLYRNPLPEITSLTVLLAIIKQRLFMGSILSFLSLLFTVFALTLIVKNDGFGNVIKRGIHILPKAIGLSILTLIFIIPLFILFIIPGLIFSIYWSFNINALISENQSIWQSFKRSKDLVKNKWWTVFGYLLLVTIIFIGAIIVIKIIFSLLETTTSTIDLRLVSIIIEGLVTALFSIYLVIFKQSFFEQLKA
ncbi:MAG: hypothetical protein ABIJ21_01695 [Nanoarchaeota archaeon]